MSGHYSPVSSTESFPLLCCRAGDAVLWKQLQYGSWSMRVLVLALPLSSCVTLKKASPQGICQVVGLLGHTIVLFLVFEGIAILFSTVAVSIYIPTDKARGFPSLHIFSSIYCL